MASPPRFELHDAGEVMSFGSVPSSPDGTSQLLLPPEIAAAGSVELTAVVHDRAGEYFIWERYFHYVGANDIAAPWPAETGGAAVVDAIRRLIEEQDGGLQSNRQMIERLISPERERQRRQLKGSIERMIAVAYGKYPISD